MGTPLGLSVNKKTFGTEGFSEIKALTFVEFISTALFPKNLFASFKILSTFKSPS